MTRQTLAFCVHLFTASGAALALFAMLEAGANDWKMMFFFLLLALIVDGIDGPLARWAHVKKFAPHWDGVLLDLIIDFLTYVFIPAYALAQAGLMSAWGGWLCAIAIVTTGVVYFADTRMKTEDNSFSGFPGCWNMVMLVIFALRPSEWAIIGIVGTLCVAQFVPLKFIHPVRTERWRRLSLPVMLAWCMIALWIGLEDFETPPLAAAGLIATTLYLTFAGIAMQVVPARKPTAAE
ncbi:CDP-alcohol phosphatidyltransferase family protein [Oceanomicrobium pacificus]|uniref:Phosphatidylcholine synthase n=1 Tax=Oceanomicrobium pacificus TaxID=2692916 RepID=A0A6B0TNV4_9RHOB|nr:phosphatidylcholine synthase [Oceanomicrobium pacificus]MXU64269.1 phosphatidylcholine synthase [Oceanomicrobium pacificus]